MTSLYAASDPEYGASFYDPAAVFKPPKTVDPAAAVAQLDPSQFGSWDTYLAANKSTTAATQARQTNASGTTGPSFLRTFEDDFVHQELLRQGYTYDSISRTYAPPAGSGLTAADFAEGVRRIIERKGQETRGQLIDLANQQSAVVAKADSVPIFTDLLDSIRARADKGLKMAEESSRLDLGDQYQFYIPPGKELSLGDPRLGEFTPRLGQQGAQADSGGVLDFFGDAAGAVVDVASDLGGAVVGTLQSLDQRQQQNRDAEYAAWNAQLKEIQRAAGEGAADAWKTQANLEADFYEAIGLDDTARARRESAEREAEAVRFVAEGFVPGNVLELQMEFVAGVGMVPGAASFAKTLTKEGFEVAVKEVFALGGRAAVESLPELVNKVNGEYAGDLVRRGILEAPAYSDEASQLAGTAGLTVVGRQTPTSIVAQQPFGLRLAGGAPETYGDEIIDDLAQRIAEAGSADEVVDLVRGLDVSDRMALSLALGKENRALVESIGSLMAQADVGDLRAAQALKSQFYRDTAVLRNRATSLTERLSQQTAQLVGTTPEQVTARAKRVMASLVAEDGSVAVPEKANLLENVRSLLGAPRSLKASFDLSAPGRQGLALAFRHPVEWAQAWAPMIKAWQSAEGMAEVNAKIAEIMASWGNDIPADVIHFYDTGGSAEALSRVPGFEPAGGGVIGEALRKIPGLEKSERAYATFLNYQKAKTFDNMATALLRAGETDAEAYRNLGAIIDHATGFGAAPLQGDLGTSLLFSQRYTTSRIQFLTDPIVEGLMKGDLRAARAATENLVAFLGGMAGLLMLINESGVADVNLDPRSTDFGKIRIGSQRIDFGAGFLPLLRTAGLVVTGEGVSTTGGVFDVRPGDAVVQFFRNKLAPLPGDVVTRLTGENPVGDQPTKPGSLAFVRDMFMPLIADSVLETLEQTGDPKRAALSAASELVGGGVSVYGGGQSAQQDIAKERFGLDFDELYSSEQAEISRDIAESGQEITWGDRQSAWWTAREDALSRALADVSEQTIEDETDNWLLEEVRAGGEYGDLFPGLDDDGQLVAALQANGWTRQQAIDAVEGFMGRINLTDLMENYRREVLKIDPGMIDAWNEAYEAGEADYPPPQWAQEFVEGLEVQPVQ